MEQRLRCTRSFVVLAALALVALGPAAAQDTTFDVTVENKSADHPDPNAWPVVYAVDGEQGNVLTLTRGVTYTFQMQGVPTNHPFYLSTSEEGGGAAPYTEGVTGNYATGNQTVTFTPSEATPNLLYYQCGSHVRMGYRIEVVDASGGGDGDGGGNGDGGGQQPAVAGLQEVASGFVHPLTLLEAPDDTGRRFIVDQTGQIYILMPDGTMLDEPFLDISDRIVELNPNYDERGLLGLAFHPEYADNGRFFVYYSAPLREAAPDDFNNTSHISEFAVSASDPNAADPASETILLQVDEPQGNHAGGTVAFGPDGYLYISLGDGGGADDTGTGHVADWYADNDGGNGQDVEQNLLGSILRIDVDDVPAGQSYGIPADNPFGDEQFAYGFRNPYRFSFDMGGEHGLLVGDAGQDLYEEVSQVELGGNYGWNVREGAHCFDAENPENPPAECPTTDPEGDPLVDPVIEFLNAKQEGGLGLVVVGGNVYRGTVVPELAGKYIFGAWSAGEEETGGTETHLPGRVFVADPAAEGPWSFEEMDFADMQGLEDFVLGFGQDLDGEVYVLTTSEVGPTGTTGRVLQIVSAEAVAVEEPAEIPVSFTLDQNYPNPFNPTTTIRFELVEPASVTLSVYDASGRLVKHLVSGRRSPGSYAVEWDGTDQAGRRVASGTYFYRLDAGAASGTKAMTLLK